VKAERLEFVPSLSAISDVIASLEAGLGEVCGHFRYTIIFLFSVRVKKV